MKLLLFQLDELCIPCKVQLALSLGRPASPDLLLIPPARTLFSCYARVVF